MGSNAPDAFELVDETVEFSILYDSLKDTELSEMEMEARDLSSNIGRAEIIDSIISYQEFGLLDDEYLATPEGRRVKRNMEEHLDILGSRTRAGEIYSLMGSRWFEDTLKAIDAGDYEDLLENRPPEQEEEIKEAINDMIEHDLVTIYLKADEDGYALTDYGSGFVDAL